MNFIEAFLFFFLVYSTLEQSQNQRGLIQINSLRGYVDVQTTIRLLHEMCEEFSLEDTCQHRVFLYPLDVQNLRHLSAWTCT